MLALVVFLLHKDDVFTLSRFFLTAIVSYGTLYLALNLVVRMQSVVASMWGLTKYS